MRYLDAARRKLREYDILRDPVCQENLAMWVNNEIVDANGAAGENQDGFKSIRDQRRIWQAGARGVATGDWRWVDRAILGIEFGLKHQHRDGSFHNSSAFETLGFLHSILRMYQLLSWTPGGEAQASQIGFWEVEIQKSIDWLEDTEEDVAYAKEWAVLDDYVNAAAALAVFYVMAGHSIGSPKYQERGNFWAEFCLERQSEEGWFPEAKGPDSSFQNVTLWNLSTFQIYMPRTDVNDGLKRGFAWEKARVQADGWIDVEGNSRTKGLANYPEAIMAFMYWHYQGSDREARDIAGRLLDRSKKIAGVGADGI